MASWSKNMEIELYMISAHEEYAVKHMCRAHWNYNWRGRRGSMPDVISNIKIRKESFGGLMQSPDGKLWKLDDEAYFYLNMLLN